MKLLNIILSLNVKKNIILAWYMQGQLFLKYANVLQTIDSEQNKKMQQQKPQKIQKPVSQTAQIMRRLLKQNLNIDDVKKMVSNQTDIIEKKIFYAITSTEEQYLHSCALIYHEQEQFNYLNQLLHTRTTQVLDKINQNTIQVKSNLPSMPTKPPQEVPQQIVDEVEEVLRNVDLPLSLYKRSDRYYSSDNPKTLQVKQYIKQLHEQDKKWKYQLKKKSQDIQNQKNQKYHKSVQEGRKIEKKQKQQKKMKMAKTIQYLKGQIDRRKKSIEESLDFMKKQGRPMFKRIQEDFHNKIQIPTLEEKKKKLSEVRQMRRSVDLVEIQQHKQKYQKIKQQHETTKIINDHVKVSFKGKFYKTLEKSRISDDQQDPKSLYERKLQYGKMVKQNFKPSIDETKVNQIEQRINMMKLRRARAANRFKRRQEVDDENEDQEQEIVEEEKEPSVEEQQPQQEDSENEKPIIQRDDQEDLTREQRYQMGLKYLQQARKKRKKEIQDQKGKEQLNLKQINQSKSNRQVKTAKTNSENNLQISQIRRQKAANEQKIKYKNYLHEMFKQNRTVDFIDTQKIKKQMTEDFKVKPSRVVELQQKLRFVSQKAKQQEELLKHKKLKKSQAISRKLQLDNSILDTIKARLALMGD